MPGSSLAIEDGNIPEGTTPDDAPCIGRTPVGRAVPAEGVAPDGITSDEPMIPED